MTAVKRIELPSGGWLDVRTRAMAADKFAVQAAVEVSTAGDDLVSGDLMSLMACVLLARLTEAWSLDGALPRDHSCEGCGGDRKSRLWREHVAEYIGEALELRDYNAVETELAPDLAAALDSAGFTAPAITGRK